MYENLDDNILVQGKLSIGIIKKIMDANYIIKKTIWKSEVFDHMSEFFSSKNTFTAAKDYSCYS